MPQASTPTRRGPSLSRARVADAALELAREEGVEAVTMRRLAGRLGVGTMTLYGYFRSKEELEDAMVDRVTAGAAIQLGDGPWPEQLRGLLRGIRRTLREHPAGLEIRRRRPMLSPAALAVTEAGLQILAGAGFGREDAARAYRTLWLYVFGFVAFNEPEDADSVRRGAVAALAALPPEEYPALTQGAEQAAATMAGDEQFEYGMDLLLEGLAGRLG